MKDVLRVINNEMQKLNIPYTFDAWDKEIDLPQFIGEISEVSTLNEDGLSEYSFILTGYAVKNDSDYLFEVTNQLKQEYKPSKIVDGGAIMYENTIPIDTNIDNLKRTQTTLKIKKWSV